MHTRQSFRAGARRSVRQPCRAGARGLVCASTLEWAHAAPCAPPFSCRRMWLRARRSVYSGAPVFDSSCLRAGTPPALKFVLQVFCPLQKTQFLQGSTEPYSVLQHRVSVLRIWPPSAYIPVEAQERSLGQCVGLAALPRINRQRD